MSKTGGCKNLWSSEFFPTEKKREISMLVMSELKYK